MPGQGGGGGCGRLPLQAPALARERSSLAKRRNRAADAANLQLTLPVETRRETLASFDVVLSGGRDPTRTEASQTREKGARPQLRSPDRPPSTEGRPLT